VISRVQAAEQLMKGFLARTGICGGGDAARRYLWTDAFAVFALLSLHSHNRNQEYLSWARRLVERVHRVLGRYREDDHRSGWISGLSEIEGERRPTVGGLRIGKLLPERSPRELYDEHLEWERDGQYFHYLTKWMHALNRMSVVTGDPRYNEQAADLAMAAHRAFVYAQHGLGSKRMYWKMSTDLTRRLVHSMGHLDPLDGLVTFSRVRAAQHLPAQRPVGLDYAVADMWRMCETIDTWATTDPLSIGGLLTEAGGVVQLTLSDDRGLDAILGRLLADAERSLQGYAASGQYVMRCESRLAFRELGLSIGLQSLNPMRADIKQCPALFGGPHAAAALLASIESLSRFAPLIEQFEQSWLAPAAQSSTTWTAHLDINSVMLATSLVPEVYLLPQTLGRPGGPHGPEARLSKELST
jgi:hypothetical protein